MRLLVLSDLHDDFWVAGERDPFAGIEHLIADLDHLLIASDLTNKHKSALEICVREIVTAFAA